MRDLRLVIDQDAIEDERRIPQTPARRPPYQRMVDLAGERFSDFLSRTHTEADAATPAHVRVWMTLWADTPVKKKSGIAKPRSPRGIRAMVNCLNAWYDDRGIPSPGRTPEVSELLSKLYRDRGIGSVRKKTLKHERARAAMLALDESANVELWAKAVFGYAWCSTASTEQIMAITGKDVVREDVGIVVSGTRATENGPRPRSWKIAFGPDSRSCAATAVLTWIERSGAGPDDSVFRVSFDDDGTVMRPCRAKTARHIVKRATEIALQKIGLNPSEYNHASLRRGYIRTALEAGHSIRQIKARTGHSRVDSLVDFMRGEPIWSNEKSLI